ncbi:MAG: hydrogenase [Deltaproteobacteria bacterium]|nr:hydrogenase [Deltaproteobacteria bacterium]
MWRIPLTRIRQKHRTARYPRCAPALPERFRGRPVIGDALPLDADVAAFTDCCPTHALSVDEQRLVQIDLGRCLFCGACEVAGGSRVVSFGRDHRLAAKVRGDLIVDKNMSEIASALDSRAQGLFGRSLKLRQVSAGGCNACEADTNVLGTLVFDLGRFGIQFVASPRHADGLLITGPVPLNMKLALEKTYDATPAPKIVIAVGACAISGGPYIDHEETCQGASGILPVDLHIPGCPPHPYTILDGLLGFLGRL